MSRMMFTLAVFAVAAAFASCSDAPPEAGAKPKPESPVAPAVSAAEARATVEFGGSTICQAFRRELARVRSDVAAVVEQKAVARGGDVETLEAITADVCN